MRYCLSINLNYLPTSSFSFGEYLIGSLLEIERTVQPESYLSLTTLRYHREKPGLIEHNWEKPWYNDEEHFIFLGGSVLFRNRAVLDGKYVPTPKEVLSIVRNEGDKHYKTLKGNYYLVLLHKRNRAVEIYASPMSMHPAFFSFVDNHLIFTNYLESVHKYRNFSIDQRGLVEFALFDHCLHDRTIYTNVNLIPGGHHYHLAGGVYKARLAYDLADWYTPRPQSRKEALEKINRTLRRAITTYVESTDKLNMALTGGFDGRLNFSFLEKKDYPKVKGYSYGMPGSTQISIPECISESLGLTYEPVFFSEGFEQEFPQLGMDSILLTCGITGFNRAVYPYAYSILKEYSRSCLLGQCDMIRPLFNNPAGVIFNDFSSALFFGDYHRFKTSYQEFASRSFIDPNLFSPEIGDAVYEEVQSRYRKDYQHLDENLRFYFFLLKESLMKYWHTEFHLVDIFVDDYVSFADLDYLEVLFSSKYAGIYKGLFAKNQWSRRYAHDLYVDLMALNNDRLNYFYNDRQVKPGWLKYGIPGMALAITRKQVAKFSNRGKGDDTFDMKRWAASFIQANRSTILEKTELFDSGLLKKYAGEKIDDWGNGYRFNRMTSLKIWLNYLSSKS